VQRFRNILFSPLGDEGNAEAFGRTVELAKNNGASVQVLGVAPEPSAFQRVLHPWPAGPAVDETLREHLAADLQRWCTTSTDVPVSIDIESGSPALRLVERVLRDGHDLLVVTSGHDRRSHAIVKRLLRKCPCPVYVVRPMLKPSDRVLAAIDPDPHEVELSRTILELAGSLAEWLDLELHVVHSWELYGESTMRSSAFLHVDDAEIEEMRRRVKTEEHSAVDSLVAEVLGADRATVHIVEGHAGEAIPKLIDELGVHRLVLGTLARAGVPGLVMGNTAEQILDSVSCSVLAVKPPGFVSPIAPPPS
jgi:nucleotide-binding universal stress UspA family protein